VLIFKAYYDIARRSATNMYRNRLTISDCWQFRVNSAALRPSD